MVTGSVRLFWYSSSVYSCHFFLISSTSVQSLLHLSILASNIPLISSIFLKRFLVIPILLFSSICFHCSFKKAFLSLLAILWNSAFSWVYHLCLLLLLSVICKVFSDNSFAFLHFFFLAMVMITMSCTMLQNSIHSFSDTLSTKSNPLNLFVTSTV